MEECSLQIVAGDRLQNRQSISWHIPWRGAPQEPHGPEAELKEEGEPEA